MLKLSRRCQVVCTGYLHAILCAIW